MTRKRTARGSTTRHVDPLAQEQREAPENGAEEPQEGTQDSGEAAETTEAPDTLPVGSVWSIPVGGIVARPDGYVLTTAGGKHVLDIPGEYVCGDLKVTAE